jgi:chitin disaccharide deacetylase
MNSTSSSPRPCCAGADTARRRLLFNCDDFGRDPEINTAILKAHREGVLQSASLMVTGSALDEAVAISGECPALKVGLHLALSEVLPVRPPHELSDLVSSEGRFLSPGKSGLRLAVSAAAREQAKTEIKAQFEKYASLRLPRDHVDGHHHLHMHPFVFDQCLHWARHFGFQRIRIADEAGAWFPPRRNASQFVSKWMRHLTFRALAKRARKKAAAMGVSALTGVLGLWETGCVSEDYLLQAIPKLPPGDWEVYVHVGSPGSECELEAMLSEKVKALA